MSAPDWRRRPECVPDFPGEHFVPGKPCFPGEHCSSGEHWRWPRPAA